MLINLKKIKKLKSGENPYQGPAYLCKNLDIKTGGYSLVKLKKVSGETPCYTNLVDLNNILQTSFLVSRAFEKHYQKVPYISIAAKHGNPCGLSIDWERPEKSVKQALWGNAQAIWGGEFILNFKVTKAIAKVLYESQKRKDRLGKSKWMLDIIAAPEIDEAAKKLLGKRKRTKVYTSNSLYRPEMPKNYQMIKSVLGGYLIQPPNNYILDFSHLEWTKEQPDKDVINSIIIAWATAYSSFHGGNEIALARDNQLIGVGGGPSTVEAAKIAIWRAQENSHLTKDSVFAADAFFPFTDTPEVLKNAKCICGVVPAGGVNHKKIKKYFKDNKIKCGFIPKIYRGFCRH
ncbi:MAG: hypothetical protein C0412_09810 [Flavobacterium sp.]|nr:hypothetical protein [Flavobacterium sp.]